MSQKSTSRFGMASSSPVAVSREGELWTICMDAGENRFNPRMISALNAALDQVESCSGAACVLFTSASPKFFSNGLDLDHIARSELSGFVSREFEPFLARVLGFSVPTLAVINGHAFAGGFMLALACDYRVQNAHRGFCCLNELLLGMPLTPGMNALVECKLPQPALLRDAVLQARRLTASEALARGVVDAMHAPAELRAEAVAFARPMASHGKNRSNYAALKAELYRQPIAALRRGTPLDRALLSSTHAVSNSKL